MRARGGPRRGRGAPRKPGSPQPEAGNKLEDLLSARLNIVAGVLGMLILLAGASWVLLLALEKVESSQGGFLNPYSFLGTMLLFMSGIHIVIFALLANLLIQVRREVSRG